MNLEQWLRHIESVHFRSIDMQLDRVHRVMRKVLPKGPTFSAVSVAGTNGKGTAVEVITQILLQTGARVGTYTSPHLVRYTERIRVNGIEVGESELCAAFEQIDEERGATPLTYFEFGTLAALLIFEQRRIDVAVLEVGMGGRLDAVNVVDACAALITSISLDHQSWLGQDRESIAAEKAGIFRPGAPAICADPDPPAAIGAHARRVGADLKQLGRDFEMRRNDGGWEWEASGVRFSLPAMHERGLQPDNIAGALMALVCLGRAVSIGQEQILRGLSALSLRGRFEILPGQPQIILDVAHNPAAIRALRHGLSSHACSGRTLAVCGMLKDKAAKTMAAMLDPIVDEWRVGTIHDPRGRSAEDLGAEISASSGKPLFRHESVLSAFEAARRAADPADRILVFGSFHTVGDIIRALEGEVQLS